MHTFLVLELYMIVGVINAPSTDPLVQMVVDNSRHILYTRSNKNIVTVLLFSITLCYQWLHGCVSAAVLRCMI